jgi:hypothetical protein
MTIIIIILFLHWIADFVCQTDWQAKNKSKNNHALFSHVINYTLIFLVFSIVITGLYDNILFLLYAPITFTFHFLTDYITSRVNSKLWSKNKVHEFFVSVGFDQFLHVTQLLLTYYFMI